MKVVFLLECEDCGTDWEDDTDYGMCPDCDSENVQLIDQWEIPTEGD